MNHVYVVFLKDISSPMQLESIRKLIVNFIKLKNPIWKLDDFKCIYFNENQVFVFYMISINEQDSKELTGLIHKDEHVIGLKHYAGYTKLKCKDIFDNMCKSAKSQSQSALRENLT